MSSTKPLKAILISLLGNSFEWYDFMVYAALAPVLAKVFFPEQQGIIALLATYGTFAAGFITRPFGALLFGYLGDHFGRRCALLSAIGLMMAPTLAIGCLPSFTSAGIWAPCLLVTLRLLQGLAMSGEMPGCITFLTEMSPLRWKSTVTSLAVVAALVGLLLGTNGVWWLNSHFGETAVQDWLWRTPFWFSGLLGLLILLLRRKLPESTAFLRLKQAASHPVASCIKHHWRSILLGIGCYAANGIGFYFLMAFSQTYFHQFLHLPLATALKFNIWLQVVMLLILPIGGYLADCFGRRVIGLMSIGIMLIGLYSSLKFLSQLTDQPSLSTIGGLTLIASVFAIYSAILPSTTATLFPTPVRYTGVALLNNISLTIFGGLSPMLISFLITHYQSLTVPAWPMAACLLLSFGCFWKMPAHNTKIVT